jgi:RNA polymerase sigma-70 factor (ECF subfamily)
VAVDASVDSMLESRATDFKSLWDQHHQAIYRYALRRVPGPDAVDVVSETFFTAWRRSDELPVSALPWLYGIARHVVSNQNRARRRQDRLAARLANVGIEPASDHALDAADRDVVSRALSELSPDDQEVLRLAYWEDLSSDSIAIAMNCSSAAARLRLHRTRSRLRRVCDADRRASGHVHTGTSHTQTPHLPLTKMPCEFREGPL